MPKTAFIFPGQGSQYVGMGKDLVEKYPVAKELFQQADDLLDFSLSTICFNGPEEELKQTTNTQPAIFLHSIALARILGLRDITMVAGHSLGEYSALVYAGSISFEDGLKTVRLRGELMQKAGELQQGTMAAVVGLDPSTVEAVCTEASTEGIVQCANFNSPGQIVISGSVPGVRKGMELAKARGAKLVKELVVSGAFHSPLMEYAVDGLSEALLSLPISAANIPVYANVTARAITGAEEIRQLLKEQLTKPVRWEESVQSMVADGATRFVEVGPGKVLQGLVKRIAPNVEISGIDKSTDIESLSAL